MPDEKLLMSSRFEVNKISTGENAETVITLEKRSGSNFNDELAILQNASKSLTSEKVWEKGVLLPYQTDKIFLEFTLKDNYPALPNSGEYVTLSVYENYCSHITFSGLDLSTREVKSYTVCTSKCDCAELTTTSRVSGSEKVSEGIYGLILELFGVQ